MTLRACGIHYQCQSSVLESYQTPDPTADTFLFLVIKIMKRGKGPCCAKNESLLLQLRTVLMSIVLSMNESE